MKKHVGKLNLDRETLKTLDADRLSEVDGGRFKLTRVSECEECYTYVPHSHCRCQ